MSADEVPRVNTTTEVTLLDNAQVRMRITVPGDEVRREYDAIVKEYCAHARIPGFRKGKVPADVMVRKLGSSLTDETRAQVIEKAVKDAFEHVEQKPFPYANPEVEAGDPIEPGRDWSFAVTYDTFPAVELGPYAGVEVEEPSWQVDDEDIGRELSAVREQNALFTDKEPPVVARGDIANIDYVELEAGSEKPATRRQAFVFEVGTGYNSYRLDDEIVGMAKGETRDITKVYPAEDENRDLAGRSVSLRVTVNSVKEKKLPELNDELAQDISEKFKTLDDLKADIQTKLDAAVKAALRSAAINTVLAKVIETSKIPLPKSLVEYQLDAMWHDYVRETRIEEGRLVELLRAQGRDPAAMRTEMTPAAEQRARLQLVISEISKREQIGVEEAEIEAEIGRLAAARRVEAKDLRENLARNDLLDTLAGNLRLEKLYDHILSKSVVKTAGEKKVLDILRGA
jgi:trigger factor